MVVEILRDMDLLWKSWTRLYSAWALASYIQTSLGRE